MPKQHQQRSRQLEPGLGSGLQCLDSPVLSKLDSQFVTLQALSDWSSLLLCSQQKAVLYLLVQHEADASWTILLASSCFDRGSKHVNLTCFRQADVSRCQSDAS